MDPYRSPYITHYTRFPFLFMFEASPRALRDDPTPGATRGRRCLRQWRWELGNIMGYIGGNIGIMENKMETTIMGKRQVAGF